MKTGRLRYASFAMGIILALLFLSARECPAQSAIPPSETPPIVIPQEELEKYTKRLDMSQLSPEEALGLLGLMSKAREGSYQPTPPSVVPSQVGSPASSISIFPQIPPAVANTRETLGRWMVFQAKLLDKIAKVYAAYGEELLQQTPQVKTPKPSSQNKEK
jgi:hypothetical protein